MNSWNEIRKAATAFSKRWKTAFDEKSQAQSFLKEFFAVFGVDAVTVATFEHRVKFVDGSQGYADCFWQGRILVEMKSRGKDLDAAYEQAMEYVRSLPDASQTPRAIVVSDFARVRFYDLANDCALTEFALKDLRKYVTLFGFMIGEDGGEIREQDPVNHRAAEKMARLHAMKAVGYTGHPRFYMAIHQHDPNANPLWLYFQQVVNWAKATFPVTRAPMKKVPWGLLYNKFAEIPQDPKTLEKRIAKLVADSDVQKKSGIWEYVLDRDERHLGIRAFDDNTRLEAYERQHGVCPLCSAHFELSEMEADHITPWRDGGRTIPANCQMLCRDCNRRKGAK